MDIFTKSQPNGRKSQTTASLKYLQRNTHSDSFNFKR